MDKISGFCCICLEDFKEFKSVTDCDSNGVKYSKKLVFCDENQNWEDEALILCQSCIEKLNLVYDFIEQCKNSAQLRIEKLTLLKISTEEKYNESFTCYMCKKEFSKKRFLKTHITRIHLSETTNKTDEFSRSSLDNSFIATNRKKEIKNEFPQLERETFSSYEDRKDEIKLEKKWKKLKTFTCEYCGKQFNRHQHWSAHIRSKHTFEKPYKCQLCDANFTTSHSLLVHKRNHNNEKPYICSTCGKGFVCSGDLFHHNKIHLNRKEYECNICCKRFNTTSILRTHKIVKHTQPEDWKYVCIICTRRFPINSSLSLHMKRHTGIKDHSCHICGKKFFNKSEVTKHILSHSNQRRFKCDLCEDKEYKNKEGLNKHLKIIHDLGTWKAPNLEKKFLCVLCPKRFSFNNKLQRHLLTHTGDKPYKCEFCEKKFSDIYYRKNHMKKEHKEQFEEDDDDVVSQVKYVELVTISAPNEFA